MLFEGPDEWLWGSLAVDSRNLYWITSPTGIDQKLWRGRKDGTGEAEVIAHGWNESVGPVLTSTALYWIVVCDPHSYLVRLPK